MSDLLPVESDALQNAEKTIERGLSTFIDVGQALAEIRDQRLYRADYGTFEDYCSARWNMSRSRAYEMIDAAEVADQVSAIADKAPELNAGQARALKPVIKEHGVERAAEIAHELHQEGRLTASNIKQAASPVAEVTERTTQSVAVKRHVDMETGEVLDEPRDVVDEFLNSDDEAMRSIFRKDWAAALHRACGTFKWTPEQIAELGGHDAVDEYQRQVDNMQDHLNRAKDQLPAKVAHLRSVNGAAQ